MPPAYLWTEFQTFSDIFLTTFAATSLPCHSPAWIPAVPSSVGPKLCSHLSQQPPPWKIACHLFLSNIQRLIVMYAGKKERAWRRNGLGYQQENIHDATINSHYTCLPCFSTILPLHVLIALGACLWGRCIISGKNGGLQAAVPPESLELK